ncbi:MAG TPA: alpha-mannosidase, partial [Terracidiphilus sp.]
MKRATIIFAFLCFAAFTAQAQSGQTSEITKSLSTESQKTIDQLSVLTNLPSGEWHYHVGDIAHGETPELDDSQWQTVTDHSHAPNEAVWYRRWVEIPASFHGYDLSGARIWFQFVAGANGPMPQIIYFNGRRVAMGDDLEPIVLFDSAKPGEKVLVAVKLLHTVDQKTFVTSRFRIDTAPSRPNPEDLRKEFLSAAALIPALSSDPSASEQTLEKAISSVDLAALDAGNQTQFDTSLKKAQAALDSLRPMLRQATFHLTGNSHIDAAWLWPWTEGVDAVKRTFGTALQLMYEYPDYTYTQSAAAYNQWMAEKYPALNNEIKQRIKEGRWEVLGGMWIEPDLNMPDGESLVRQILIGKRFFQQEYGVDVRIGWNPDSFGYTWQLPQIYKKSGIDYFVTQKMTWNDTNPLPLKLFWWESPDGSKVLSYFPHDYANNNLNPVRLSSDLAQARKYASGMTEMMDLYGIGDHGGGPTRAMLDQGVHWMQPDKVVPKMQFGTAQSYFSAIEPKINGHSPVWNYSSVAEGNTQLPSPPDGEISVPTWKDELYLEFHRGVFTTQAEHKKNMRDSEEWVLNAEKYASLAWLDGQSYPAAELTEAWKKVLFNQFHDTAAGSGEAVVYKDAQRDYDQVRWATNEISQKALRALTANVDTKVTAGVPVVVYNPLAWERSGTVAVDVQFPSASSSGATVMDAENHTLPS